MRSVDVCGSLAPVIKAIAVQRYRGFAEEAVLELSPLTLLMGRNSAGKSALLRALPLVAASAGPTRPNRTGPLALEHEAAMGASYDEIRCTSSPLNDLIIRLSWGDVSAAFEVEYHIRDITDLSRAGQVVESWIVRDSGRPVLHTVLDLDSERYEHQLEKGRGDLRFESLRPSLKGDTSESTAATLRKVEARLVQFESGVDWLGPLRDTIPRRAKIVPNPTILHDGRGTVEVLAHASNRALLQWVSRRTQAMFGHELTLRTAADEASLGARFPNGYEAELADVGSGVSQTVPVLTHLARLATGGATGRIIAIEQPEAHLHADAEVALGQSIVEAVNQARGTAAAERPVLVVESHAENVVLAIQLALIKKQLQPEDVVAYWVSRGDGGATAERHVFDAQGRPDPPWGSDVFSQTTELARQVVNARRSAVP